MIETEEEYEEIQDTYDKLFKIILKSFSDPKADNEIKIGLLIALHKIYGELNKFAESKMKKPQFQSYIL